MSVLTLCVLLGVTAVHGKDTDEKKAARVKAGLVYHLAGLTQWPDGRFETNTTPITVGVLGDDPHGFADYFSSQSANVTAQGRRFVVQKLSFRGAGRGKADIAPALKIALRACEVLFVTRSENRNLAQIMSAVGESGVLTVGESDTFSSAGGMVSFVIDRGVVKILVNLRSLKKGSIQTSSEFLRHAQIVEGPHELD